MTVPEASHYWLTRLCFQRALAFVYLIAFVILVNQIRPLVGEHGILPARLFVRRAWFWDAPSLFFWIRPTDFAFAILSWAGVGLSLLALTGISDSRGIGFSAGIWFALWALYMSFANIGQVFYGYGWESLLLETGFLAIFLGPARIAPPILVIWMLRWVLFRVMFGAGMIKLRGDPCWRDLTCMLYHYETQPLPNPLSWYFHRQPVLWHKLGVLFTHLVELPVPFGFFGPALVRNIAGALTVVFQLSLIISGNLSWLNYITLVLCIPCFDDSVLSRLVPIQAPALEPLSIPYRAVVWALALVISVLSIRPARNLFSREQIMNTSFDPFRLVNTYGAFGGITRVRREVIIEGTDSPVPGASASWRAYEFKCKPGDVRRMPCVVSPYHLRIDWQMWFAAMSDYSYHPWILSFIARLLEGNRAVAGLLASDPFPHAPPRFIRAELYEYHFTRPGDPTGNWWQRERIGQYLPPLSLDDPAFRKVLESQGWLDSPS